MSAETSKPTQAKPIAAVPGWVETGLTALKLGLASFGGPAAHIGYFREEYVRRKQWLDEAAFADLNAMCQFLPGPASSQLGMAIAMRRAGIPGAIAAWAGFTLPSALLMTAFAYGYHALDASASGILHGLKLAAVAVVAHAVWSMGRTLTPDLMRIGMALITAVSVLLFPGIAGQLVPLAACGAAGWIFMRKRMPSAPTAEGTHAPTGLSRRFAWGCLILFALLLVLFPWLARETGSAFARIADIGYRAGALVFGGGHVVLPMLEQESVRSGLLGEEQFMAGYGAAQAVPGPLFTFSAYIGAASSNGWDGVLRAAAMLVSIFLPSFLLVAGAMPFWERLRANVSARAALAGVNASVVGLLLAALYDPVWKTAVYDPADAAVCAAAFAALLFRKIPPLWIAAACAAAGWLTHG
ncbi:chromate efflux transporter [Cohnella caldifontis]|uniref:chromate efflux transporter n=1 Tax=Cohnella caldifontis TaxID=3027471 RepID=UPI0023EDD815|nr:chromate efflux transporter [Cohnella sp. YIM B05605]